MQATEVCRVNSEHHSEINNNEKEIKNCSNTNNNNNNSSNNNNHNNKTNNKQLNKFVNIYKSINSKPIPQVSTLQELIGQLHEAFATDMVDIDYVQELMTSYKSNPHDWRKYAKFDRYRYTRNLVDIGNGKFNLIVLCWGEGHGSAIHDHADAHCVMKVLQGELAEVRYAWPANSDNNSSSENGESIPEMERNTFGQNSVCYINDSLGLHRVENPSTVNPAVSLHLYSPPFTSCSIFNKQTGQRSPCKVTYWSKFGERRNREIQDARDPEDN